MMLVFESLTEINQQIVASDVRYSLEFISSSIIAETSPVFHLHHYQPDAGFVTELHIGA